MNWVAKAVLYVQDTSRGRVLIGSHGFAWWNIRRVFVVAFPAPTRNLLRAYKEHSKSDNIRSYASGDVTKETVLVFVRTGLWPAQGKFA